MCPEHGGTAFANARLIASAPALLAALKRAGDVLDGQGGVFDPVPGCASLRADLRELINRAEQGG